MDTLESFHASRSTYDAQKHGLAASLMEAIRRSIRAKDVTWPAGEVIAYMRSKLELRDMGVKRMLQDAFDADDDMRAFRVMNIDTERTMPHDSAELCLGAMCCIPAPLILVHVILTRMHGHEYCFRIRLAVTSDHAMSVVGVPVHGDHHPLILNVTGT